MWLLSRRPRSSSDEMKRETILDACELNSCGQRNENVKKVGKCQRNDALSVCVMMMMMDGDENDAEYSVDTISHQKTRVFHHNESRRNLEIFRALIDWNTVLFPANNGTHAHTICAKNSAQHLHWKIPWNSKRELSHALLPLVLLSTRQIPIPPPARNNTSKNTYHTRSPSLDPSTPSL